MSEGDVVVEAVLRGRRVAVLRVPGRLRTLLLIALLLVALLSALVVAAAVE